MDQQRSLMADSKTPSIVLVGHCVPDLFMMRSAIARVVGDAEIVHVNDDSALDAHRNSNSIWLVNRVLDGQFTTGSGLDLIEANADKSDGPAMLLISDKPDAQDESLKRGALPGFGKRALYDAATAQRLRAAVSDLASRAAR
jgi:hypothetical protein